MKTPVRIATLVLVGVMSPGMAGTWKMNPAKSTFSPGPAPKSMSITYTPSGDAMKIDVTMTPADGPAQHWVMTAAYDGKPAPVVGNPDADAITLKRVDANRGESTFTKAGKVMAVNKRTLSADGKTLTIATTGVNGKGQPRNDVAVYER
jgi:hypothetical protein